MARLGLRLTLQRPAMEACTSSLRSVFDVLETSGRLREHVADAFPDLFDTKVSDGGVELVVNSADLFVGKVVDGPAFGADEISFRTEPSDRYVELVSAVARNGDVPLNMNFAHGWPILSLGVVANTSVLDGSGAASVAPGRAA